MIKPFYKDTQITEYHGHTPDVLKELPSESVHMVVTSVPYWGLRDYDLEPQVWDEVIRGNIGDCEHEWGDDSGCPTKIGKQGSTETIKHPVLVKTMDKPTHGQFCQKCNAWRGSLGLEPSPDLFIQHIVQVFREVRRVLRKDGTVWLNIGDSYASQPASTGISFRRDRAVVIPRGRNLEGLKPKDLCMIPCRVALALQADGWWLRSDIIWAKPNPMPESVTDRPTNSHEHVFLLVKSQKYFYDAEAVREDSQASEESQKRAEYGRYYLDDGKAKRNSRTGKPDYLQKVGNDYGYCGQRNLRNVWTIATEPTPEAHFATFPSKLCEIAIKAGTSEKGCCPECGTSWVRIVEKEIKPHPNRWSKKPDAPGNYEIDTGSYQNKGTSDSLGMAIESKTIGWEPSCMCLKNGGYTPLPCNPIPCTVLDPFSGSGRTLIVAKKLGRKAIGIDLKKEYLKMPLSKLAQERLI